MTHDSSTWICFLFCARFFSFSERTVRIHMLVQKNCILCMVDRRTLHAYMHELGVYGSTGCAHCDCICTCMHAHACAARDQLFCPNVRVTEPIAIYVCDARFQCVYQKRSPPAWQRPGHILGQQRHGARNRPTPACPSPDLPNGVLEKIANAVMARGNKVTLQNVKAHLDDHADTQVNPLHTIADDIAKNGLSAELHPDTVKLLKKTVAGRFPPLLVLIVVPRQRCGYGRTRPPPPPPSTLPAARGRNPLPSRMRTAALATAPKPCRTTSS